MLLKSDSGIEVSASKSKFRSFKAGWGDSVWGGAVGIELGVEGSVDCDGIGRELEELLTSVKPPDDDWLEDEKLEAPDVDWIDVDCLVALDDDGLKALEVD